MKARDLLVSLRMRGIKNTAIADVMGVTQSRVTEMFKFYGIRRPGDPEPDPESETAENGKTKDPPKRKLGWDEGVDLCREFGVDGEPNTIPDVPIPTLRLVVQYVAAGLGHPVNPEDPKVLKLARALQAFHRFVGDPEVRPTVDAVSGFLRGLNSLREESPTDSEELDQNSAH